MIKLLPVLHILIKIDKNYVKCTIKLYMFRGNNNEKF